MSEPRRHILVLGDSSMASFGCCHDNAIDGFASRSYNVPVDVVNGSFAGMTAADAYVHACRVLRDQPPGLIIVCVGSCDASAYGLPKTFARNPLEAWWSLRKERGRRGHSLYRRNPPGEFIVHDVRHAQLRPNLAPDAHGRCLDAIARRCRDARVPLVVIVPVAKADFPPCNNIGNVAFYRIVNVPDDHAWRAPDGAKPLLAAFAAEAAGDTAAARRAYADLAHSHPDDELGDIARNNLACLDAAEAPERAPDMFDHAIRAGSPLGPVAVFNRCIAGVLAGERPREDLLRRAVDEDSGSYRIRGPWRDAALAALRPHDGSHLTVIDALRILVNADFLDYGHPTAAGHRKLLAALAPVVEDHLGLRPGPHACSVRSASMNPDAAAGARAGVFEHFHLVHEPDAAFVAAVGAAVAQGPPFDHSPRSRAIARICAHPLFGDAGVFEACAPRAATDQGGLTELFFLRHMRALYEHATESNAPALPHDTLAPIRPDPARMDRWWPLTGVAVADPGPLLGAIDPPRLLARCQRRFAGIIDAGPVATHKYRSMPYWFLRESLVFGSPSDVSMFLDRLAALDVLDGCVAGLRVAEPGTGAARGFEDLLGRLVQLVRAHTDHVGPYADQLFLMGREKLAAYRRACDRLRD